MTTHLVVSNRPNLSNTSYFKSPVELEAFLKLHYEISTLIFAFWGWKVENWMLHTYKCFGLHTGPLLEGKGRGGSPIDNLQALGVFITTLCAFEMTDVIDGGRVKVAIPIRIDCTKESVISRINDHLPLITEYLATVQPDIPERFNRTTLKELE